jgi:hypothetical protein
MAYEKAFHCPICRASIFFDEVEASSFLAKSSGYRVLLERDLLNTGHCFRFPL